MQVCTSSNSYLVFQCIHDEESLSSTWKQEPLSTFTPFGSAEASSRAQMNTWSGVQAGKAGLLVQNKSCIESKFKWKQVDDQ